MRITTNSTDFYFNADAMVYTQGGICFLLR